jgi:hypothetical protein
MRTSQIPLWNGKNNLRKLFVRVTIAGMLVSVITYMEMLTE